MDDVQPSCANCARPIPTQKRRGTIYCDEPACCADRARRRKAKSRARARDAGGIVVDLPTGLVPGSDQFCAAHGIDPRRLKAHGVWRYSAADVEKVKDLFRGHLRSSRLGTVTRIVAYRDANGRSVGGLVLPKFPLPGHPPIPPQLRPDKPIILDRRSRWQDHGPHVKEHAVARIFWRDGVPTLGKPLPVAAAARFRKAGIPYAELIPAEIARTHIDSCKSDAFNADTGVGSHRGENPEGLHRHAPSEAKYVLLGDSKRFDVGPDGLEPLRTATRARLIMEGKFKHLAAESNGWATGSMASVTLGDSSEVKWLARWTIENNPDLVYFLGPDADWMNFERNSGAVFRQAMYLRTELREQGVKAYIASPPVAEEQDGCKCEPIGQVADNGASCRKCGGYFKGEDDFYGAGGKPDNLIVLDREEPHNRIAVHVYGLPIHGARKQRTARALRGLSLHDREGWDFLNVPLKTLQRITGARRPQDVPDILEDLGDALEIGGSLAIEKRPFVRQDGSIGVAWDWVSRPTIAVRSDLHATEKKSTLGEFWRERMVTVQQIDLLRNDLEQRIDGLERRADERDKRDADDAIAGLEMLLAEEASA